MFKDLLSIGIIEYLPNRIFLIFYSSIFVKFFRLHQYKAPYFIKKKHLISNSNSIYLTKPDQLANQIYKYKTSQSTEDFKIEKENRFTIKQKTALIVVPIGWLNMLTNEGRTQGPQIKFLIKGLTDNGFEVSTFEVINENSDFTTLENRIEKYDVVFIWSLTIISSDGNFFKFLEFYSKSKVFRAKIIGVITASPSPSRLLKYKKWSTVIEKVVYYEETSEFKAQLELFFYTIHTPYIQQKTIDVGADTKFTSSVHASCLLKYNRVAWLLTLRYQTLVSGLKCHIRTMSIPLAKKNIRELYLASEYIAAQRLQYGFGFVMIHRNYNEDAHLIGSFWDYYSLGVIPIVQMQSIRPISTYMIPFLDYFPVKSDQDLYNVLSLSKSHPEYFEKLKQRILIRMRTEFNPEIVISKLLTDSRIQI